MGKANFQNITQPATPATGRTRVYVDSVTKKLTSIDDNGNVINYGLLSEGIIELVATMNSNTLLTGGEITINAGDNTKIDIAAGTGIFADSHTDPSSPDVSSASWDAQTAVTNPGIAARGGSFVWIDSNDVIQFTAPLDGTDGTTFRDYIFLGVVLHPDRATHSGVNDAITGTPIEISSSLSDLNFALGQINIGDGNVYSAAGAALQVFKSAGYLHFTGQNYKTDRKNPNIVTIGEFSPASMTYTYRDGLGDFNTTPTTTNINPGRYDDGTGGAIPTPNGVVGATQWSVQRLYMLPNLTFVHYGQEVFETKAAAMASIDVSVFIKNPAFATVPLRAYLVVRGNATNLSDLTQAEFVCADKFGIENICGGPGKNTDTFDSVYTNTNGVVTKLTSANGPVTFQDADTPIADDFLDLKRSGGTESAFKVDTDRMVSPTPASAPADGDLDTSTITLYLDETNDVVKAKSKDSGDVVTIYDLSAGKDPQYAEGYITPGNGVATTINTVNVWEHVQVFSNAGPVSGVTFSANSFTVADAGVYRVTYSVSATAPSNNQTFEYAFSVDDAIDNSSILRRKINSITDAGAISMTTFLDLSASEVVKFETRNITGTANTTFTHGNINIELV